MTWDPDDFFHWWLDGPMLKWGMCPQDLRDYNDAIVRSTRIDGAANSLGRFKIFKRNAEQGNPIAIRLIAWLIAQRLTA